MEEIEIVEHFNSRFFKEAVEEKIKDGYKIAKIDTHIRHRGVYMSRDDNEVMYVAVLKRIKEK